MTRTHNDIGKAIRSYREKKALGLREFARILEIDHGNLSRIENGAYVGIKTILRICDALNLNPKERTELLEMVEFSGSTKIMYPKALATALVKFLAENEVLPSQIVSVEEVRVGNKRKMSIILRLQGGLDVVVEIGLKSLR